MIALSLAYIASISRIMRSSMIEVMHSNFIRTARAKGLPMRKIVWRHALRPHCYRWSLIWDRHLWGLSRVQW